MQQHYSMPNRDNAGILEHPPPRWLGSAPNGRQPRLPVPRQSRQPAGWSARCPDRRNSRSGRRSGLPRCCPSDWTRTGRPGASTRHEAPSTPSATPGSARGTATRSRTRRRSGPRASHRQKVLMEDPAPRIGARHGGEFLRSVEARHVVAQRPEEVQVPPGSAPQIENGIGGIALDGIQQRRRVLADVVVPGAVPIGLRRPIVVGDGHVRHSPQGLGIVPFGVCVHLSASTCPRGAMWTASRLAAPGPERPRPAL